MLHLINSNVVPTASNVISASEVSSSSLAHSQHEHQQQHHQHHLEFNQLINELSLTNLIQHLVFAQLDSLKKPLTTNSNENENSNENHHDNANDNHNSFQCGYPKRVRSLVEDAKFDTQRNRELIEIRTRWLTERLKQEGSFNSITGGLGDESQIEEIAAAAAAEKCAGGKLINNNNNNSNNSNNQQQQQRTSTEELIAAVLKQHSIGGGSVGSFVAAASIDEAVASLAATINGELESVSSLVGPQLLFDYPRHISQLDQCNHLLIKYEPELDPTHPGFHDLEYRLRRKEVAQIAFNYKHGERIPEVVYNEREIQTWRFIYNRLKEAYAKYACEQHNRAIEQLEKECGYSPNSIPQLQRVSEFLEKRTGWRLRPAAGLLSARDFLASLAFRVFQTTQYIRHWGNPEHSVEPDCIHELMGHIPMLCDPSFAQFSQEIGLASLGASDEQIEKFATLYWFTVEFGLCRENGQLKCYGAGLLSSYGEMEHALESNKPTLKEFIPEETAIETYDDAEYQVSYYVAQSFEDAKLKIKQYAEKHLNRDYELAYEPYSCTIQPLDSLDRLEVYAEQVKNDVMRLSAAITKMGKLSGEHRVLNKVEWSGKNKMAANISSSGSTKLANSHKNTNGTSNIAAPLGQATTNCSNHDAEGTTDHHSLR